MCVISGALTGCSGASSTTPIPVSEAAAQPRNAPVVAVLGDSFTVGSGPVRTWDSYAAKVARQFDWQLIVAGASGTGFVNPGRVGRNFHESFVQELAWRPAPDMLIVSGGHNDRRTHPLTVYRAAAKLLRAVRIHWPGTRVVVVGPIWIGGAPRWAYPVRDAISLASKQSRVTFLDPLARRWITPRTTGILLPDGVHPTHQGHVRLARWLALSLQARGITAGR
ncbi:SGNH/GDSL hydrolase family protein [Sinosporangium album]|uniref:SGNH/GDSL hydrolase family protein n=1 Tax=Sinosporangium album TaxID=504805 RepID=UPI0015A4C3AA|nr:SGNH/GDSL hydrolase family protein [Sinosporangium album]